MGVWAQTGLTGRIRPMFSRPTRLLILPMDQSSSDWYIHSCFLLVRMNYYFTNILCRTVGLAFAFMIATTNAAPLGDGLSFNATSRNYDADFADLNLSQNLSVELWLQPNANCPEGAVIVNKLGPGTKQGIQLEVGRDGSLR